MEIVYTEDFYFDKVMSFIEDSINEFRFKRFHSENIIILLPPHFSIVYELYIRQSCFASFIVPSTHLFTGEIKYNGISILFLSPENKCYVMTKDYSYNEDKKLLRNSLCLDRFITKK